MPVWSMEAIYSGSNQDCDFGTRRQGWGKESISRRRKLRRAGIFSHLKLIYFDQTRGVSGNINQKCFGEFQDICVEFSKGVYDDLREQLNSS